MKKYVLKTAFLVLIVCLFTCVKINAAGTTFNVTSTVDYTTSEIIITGVTPAKYRQLINVIIYTPEELSVPGDVENRENPQKQFPLTKLESIQRIENVHADIKGNFSVNFKTTELPEGYYIVSASGGGYMSDVSKDSELMYLSSADNISNTLLPEISEATGEDLKTAIDKLKNEYGINPGSGYENNQDKFISFFVTVREEDFLGCFESISSMQNAFDGVNLIMKTVDDTSLTELKTVMEAENDTFALFDETDKDYVENSEAVYQILKNIAGNEKSSFGIGSLRTMLFQAQGLATINTKNSETVTECIHKYGDELGIDLDDYNKYCNKYGEIAVNLDFIGRNFTKPEEFVKAYNDSIKALTNTSGGSGGGGGGSVPSIPGTGTTDPDTIINIASFTVSSKELSYTISVEDYRYSTVCVAVYNSNMKLCKIKLYKLTKQGMAYISGEMLKDSGMKYFRVFCIDGSNLEPSCVNIEKRI